MKKLLFTTAIIMAMGSTAALAHHPAEDIIDPDIYAMINENLEEAESPHLDMTFDDMMSGTTTGTGTDMSGDTSEVGQATESADGVRNSNEVDGGDFTDVGEQFNENVDDVGNAENQREVSSSADIDPPGAGSRR